MGNNDSRHGSALQREGSQSYAQSPSSIHREEHKNKLAKHRSLSPKTSMDRSPRRTESFKNHTVRRIPSIADNTSIASNDFKKHRPLSRRAKSFRYPNRSHESSFRVPVCSITGLSVNQKKMIKLKWAELDRQAINDMGRNIFETTFRKDPKLLKVIGLDRLSTDSRQMWKENIKFKVHFQRFANTLNEVIRTLEEPQLTTDRLLEFGAEYALYLSSDAEIRTAIVPSNYWETLIFGFNNAAKDLQVESSRGSESPSLTNSTERRFLLPSSAAADDYNQTNTQHQQVPSYLHPSNLGDTSPQLSTSLHAGNTSSRYCHSAPILDSSNQGNKLDTEGSNTASSTPTPSPSVLMNKRGFGFGSVCPREAEAWNLLAVYVVGQLKFGYSMEMLLQEQIKRLSQKNADEEEEDEEPFREQEVNLKKVASMKTTKTLRSSSTIATPPIYLQCSLTEPVPIV